MVSTKQKKKLISQIMNINDSSIPMQLKEKLVKYISPKGNILRIKTENPYCKQYYCNYKKKYETDSGLDLVTPQEITVKPSNKKAPFTEIDLEICTQLKPADGEPSGYMLCPRSSFSKTGLVLSNSFGIIDWEYRGNIRARVYNYTQDDVVLEKGEKYFQICLPSLKPFDIKLTKKLDESSRGSNGFGSTGK